MLSNQSLKFSLGELLETDGTDGIFLRLRASTLAMLLIYQELCQMLWPISNVMSGKQITEETEEEQKTRCGIAMHVARITVKNVLVLPLTDTVQTTALFPKQYNEFGVLSRRHRSRAAQG